MAVVLSTKGKQLLAYNGHMFYFDKLSADKSVKFWRCQKRNEFCKARLHTNAETDEVIRLSQEHAHKSDAAQVSTSIVITRIKRAAVETTKIPSVILNESLQSSSPVVISRLPSKDAIRKMIQRSRNEIHAAPPQPADRQSIVIPERYRTYKVSGDRRKEFLLWDSGIDDADRILEFGRESNKNWSRHIVRLYVDGTFSLFTSLFSQIYVIMADRGGFVLPIFCALLPNKTKETQVKLFEGIKTIWPELSPQSASIDFEIGAFNAIKLAYPTTEIRCCLFS